MSNVFYLIELGNFLIFWGRLSVLGLPPSPETITKKIRNYLQSTNKQSKKMKWTEQTQISSAYLHTVIAKKRETVTVPILLLLLYHVFLAWLSLWLALFKHIIRFVSTVWILRHLLLGLTKTQKIHSKYFGTSQNNKNINKLWYSFPRYKIGKYQVKFRFRNKNCVWFVSPNKILTLTSKIRWLPSASQITFLSSLLNVKALNCVSFRNSFNSAKNKEMVTKAKKRILLTGCPTSNPPFENDWSYLDMSDHHSVKL